MAGAQGAGIVITVYGMSMSGNCYKLRLLLEQLGRDYRWIEVDSARGETRTPEFLARNPNGRVPLIELEDGRVLVESNAILCWLAEGTGFVPADAWQRAQALSWMFFEQYSHEPYIAVARFIRGWTPADSPRRAELPRLRERGHQALAVMERHLQSADWFAGAAYGIADIALFAYTHCAGDGGFDLSAYPRIGAWLERVRATPGFVPMPPLDDEATARLALTD
ncbi:glutathione S-transferase family protein [Pseudoxanthomonas sp. Soil82]|uniref:glutathione S-transferase family protein n=1 Tax=Pseudoxanthomonas sp. Soil82 TaxID=3157341 RepID=UPI00338E1BC6